MATRVPAPAVVVMAKAPRPGAVKTRLQPLLGPAGCARLQAALIRRTVSVAYAVAPAGTWVAVDPPGQQDAVAALVPHARVLGQAGGDLGQRMAAATAIVGTRVHGPLLVVGTDIPALSTGILTSATATLRAQRDVVFGPAHDGGYYLAGMTRPRPELFALAPTVWGGPTVLAASLAAAARAGLRAHLLPALPDLDTPDDAATLLADPAVPAEITDLLRVGSQT